MGTFIDPLDLEPHISTEAVRARFKHQSSTSKTYAEQTESFDNVLKQEIKQEPTPIRVPKPITADVHIFPEHTRPESLSKVETAHAETAKPETAAPAASPAKENPIEVAPEPIEHNRPKNLREMLEPAQSKTIIPAEKPEAVKEDDRNVPVMDVLPQIKTSTNESLEHANQHAQEEPDQNYVIQRGDTLSGIVASRMKELGMDYSLAELYQTVKTVAQHNDMKNPDRIYVGNSIDLSPVQSYKPMIANIPLKEAKPIAAAPQIAKITSEYGMRQHPILDELRPHNGIDIRAAEGTPVLPAKAGVVTFSGEQRGYGQMIDVNHDDGTQTRYAHLSERLVSTGDHVTTHQPMGLSGSTGTATGPHLHFEFHQNGTPVDPQEHVKPEQLLAPRSPIVQQY